MEVRLSKLTREEVVAALGSVDDHLVTEILATEASAEEFALARAWLANDEAPMNAGEPLASGRVARLIELMEAADEEGGRTRGSRRRARRSDPLLVSALSGRGGRPRLTSCTPRE
jgi:hypothetical protein